MTARPLREFDGLVIAPFSDGALAALAGARGIVGSVTDDRNPQLYSVRAPYMQVSSRWGIWITVVAASSHEAQARVEDDVLPNLMTALHTLGGTPYRLEIVKVLDPLDSDSARVTPMQPTGVFGYVWVEPLTARRRDTFRRRRDAIGRDATATDSAQHLRNAVALNDLPDPTGAAEAAALLRYYLCVERIVQQVAKANRKVRRREVEQGRAAAASRMARELAQVSGLAAADAIETAARELRAADMGMAESQLREAARLLDIEKPTLDDALELYAFRSKHLAHSSIPDPTDVRGWLAGPDNRAFRVAAVFLGAYLDSVDKRWHGRDSR